MHYKKLKLIILFLIGLAHIAQAQETIPATGGMAVGSGGSVSFSVGQVTWNTFSGATRSVAQEVQQPYEISVVTGINTMDGVMLKCEVFPNPTEGVVKLVIESPDLKNFTYQLIDINGVLIQGKKVENRETSISMETLAPSTYFLNVSFNAQFVKAFKIIKTS
jgi:hypothetical protein